MNTLTGNETKCVDVLEFALAVMPLIRSVWDLEPMYLIYTDWCVARQTTSSLVLH